VGKTAIVEGLANRIVEGNVPVLLAERRILALDLSLVVARAPSIAASSKERLKALLKELKEHPEIIVFIDEIHSLIGPLRRGSLDAANILKRHCRGRRSPASVRPTVRSSAVRRKGPALSRRFQPVQVRQPSEDETISILKGVRSRFEEFHGRPLHRRGARGGGGTTRAGTSPIGSSRTRPST